MQGQYALEYLRFDTTWLFTIDLNEQFFDHLLCLVAFLLVKHLLDALLCFHFCDEYKQNAKILLFETESRSKLLQKVIKTN